MVDKFAIPFEHYILGGEGGEAAQKKYEENLKKYKENVKSIKPIQSYFGRFFGGSSGQSNQQHNYERLENEEDDPADVAQQLGLEEEFKHDEDVLNPNQEQIAKFKESKAKRLKDLENLQAHNQMLISQDPENLAGYPSGANPLQLNLPQENEQPQVQLGPGHAGIAAALNLAVFIGQLDSQQLGLIASVANGIGDFIKNFGNDEAVQIYNPFTNNNDIIIGGSKWTDEQLQEAMKFEDDADQIPSQCRRYIWFKGSEIKSVVICSGGAEVNGQSVYEER